MLKRLTDKINELGMRLYVMAVERNFEYGEENVRTMCDAYYIMECFYEDNNKPKKAEEFRDKRKKTWFAYDPFKDGSPEVIQITIARKILKRESIVLDKQQQREAVFENLEEICKNGK